MPPTDRTWGNHQMHVRDDDSNKIAFVRPVGRWWRGRRSMSWAGPRHRSAADFSKKALDIEPVIL